MKLARSLVILGLSTSLFATGVSATDFFVQAVTPGPVAGTPLAIVTLKAKTPVEEATPFASTKDRNSTTSDTSSSSERAGKWLKPPKKIDNTDTTTTTGDTTTTSGGTSTGETTTTSGGTSTGDTTTTGTGETSSTTSGETTTSTGTTTDGGTQTTTDGGTVTNGTTTGTTNGTTADTGTTTGSTSTTTTSTTTTTSGTSTTSSTSTTYNSTAPALPTSPPNTSGQVWQSFSALMGSGQVQGGDRIFLMDGYHGIIDVTNHNFSAPVTIAPVTGAVAHADSILIRGSSNVRVQGLKVWARSSTAGTGALIRSYSNTSDLVFTDLDVRSVANSPQYPSWSQAVWLNNLRPGFQVDGKNVIVARNRLTGIYHGILAEGPNALVEENIVDGFSGDGMRATGNNSVVRRNKVQNCYQINSNHADGFQSFSRGAGGVAGTGVVSNITIEDNKIFEWTQSVTSPIRCSLQGLGMFDGMYDGFVIRNNVIDTSAGHGITMAGALNTTIVNNTVVNVYPNTTSKYPWIRISPHKDGTLSNNVTVANNMAMALYVKPDGPRQIVETNNVIVTSTLNEFGSVPNQDFSLRSTSKAIDAGDVAYAPSVDITGKARPLGKNPDAGAYESF